MYTDGQQHACSSLPCSRAHVYIFRALSRPSCCPENFSQATCNATYPMPNRRVWALCDMAGGATPSLQTMAWLPNGRPIYSPNRTCFAQDIVFKPTKLCGRLGVDLPAAAAFCCCLYPLRIQACLPDRNVGLGYLRLMSSWMMLVSCVVYGFLVWWFVSCVICMVLLLQIHSLFL